MSSTSSSSSTTLTSQTFTGLGNLIKLLPTGTVFAFQFLNPVLTNNGSCTTINKVLTSVLLAVCGISCFVSSFTDSYTDSNGTRHYGIVTTTGLWPSSKSGDLSTHKLRFTDFVQAVLSVIVFGVLALLNKDTVGCFYPNLESVLVKVMPTIIGVISSLALSVLPSSRQGIGYSSSSTTNTTTTDTTTKSQA